MVDQSIERAEELEPEIVDPSKLNLVEEVSTKVILYLSYITNQPVIKKHNMRMKIMKY